MTCRSPADGGVRRKIFSARAFIDAILILVMLLVALGSGSLTLLGQAIRIALITMIGLWSSVVRAAATEDAGRRFEFGVGKLEQAGNMIVAVALAVAGLWLASRALQLILAGRSETEPFGLALAASVHALYTVRAGASIWARSTAEAGNVQAAYGVPAAATSGFLSLLIVQTALTVAALARDPAIAAAAELLGHGLRRPADDGGRRQDALGGGVGSGRSSPARRRGGGDRTIAARTRHASRRAARDALSTFRAANIR